jgi:hypothetical protein
MLVLGMLDVIVCDVAKMARRQRLLRNVVTVGKAVCEIEKQLGFAFTRLSIHFYLGQEGYSVSRASPRQYQGVCHKVIELWIQ